MMLMTFFLSFFGLLTAYRTVQFLISNQLVSQERRKNLVFLATAAFLAAQVGLFHYPMLLWILTLALFLTPVVVFQIQEHRRKRNFERNIINYLDSLIIRVRTGTSLKQASQDLENLPQGSTRFYFQEIASAIEFRTMKLNKSSAPLFEKVLSELLKINQNAYKTGDKLRSLRRQIKMTQDFRLRSRQASLQVRAQASILIIIYLALLTYVLSISQLGAIQTLVLISLTLFIVGQLLSLWIARSFKWKI